MEGVAWPCSLIFSSLSALAETLSGYARGRMVLVRLLRFIRR
jgi:hypothetical protein